MIRHGFPDLPPFDAIPIAYRAAHLTSSWALALYEALAHVITQALRFEDEPIKGSRFIADVLPVASMEAAKDALAAVVADMPDATHHCWAARMADPARHQSSDDGEPGGSAGRPILAQIEGHDVVNVLVVVTRYYGGTKLGVGGLVRAYGGAAGRALDRASLAVFVATQRVLVRHAYDDSGLVQTVLKRAGIEPESAAYGAEVALTLRVPVDDVAALAASLRDASSGRVGLTPTEADP